LHIRSILPLTDPASTVIYTLSLHDALPISVGPFTYSSTIGRNKHLIPGEVIAAVINGSQEFFDTLKQYGVDVHFMGGETADVGRSEEHTSELSHVKISYAVFCLKKKKEREQ